MTYSTLSSTEKPQIIVWGLLFIRRNVFCNYTIHKTLDRLALHYIERVDYNRIRVTMVIAIVLIIVTVKGVGG